VWETTLPGAASLIYPDEDRLFVGGEDRFLYCLSDDNGKVKWRWRTGGAIVGTGAVDNDRFYFVSFDNVLRALNRSNGNQQWKAALTLRPSAGPYLSGGLLLVVGAAAEVPAYDPKDGKAAGSVKMPEEPAVTPLLLPSADGKLGKLIVASGEGRLVQLVPGVPPLPSKSIQGLPMFPPFLWDTSYAGDIEGER
jgi:outer membrane protein assembly factor BamB